MPLRFSIIPVTSFEQNCTLLWEEQSKRGAIVDPGGDLHHIEEELARRGMSPEAILLTHGHIDHAGGAAELKERLGGIPIVGPHRADQFILDSLERIASSFGMRGSRPVRPDRWLGDGDIVYLAGDTFSVLHCPGHSPGSVAYVNHTNRLALVGDVLFRGSIGRTEGLPQADHAILMGSITTKLLQLDDGVAFICGHGPMSTIGEEKRANPYLV